MKADEIRAMNSEEMAKELAEAYKELLNLRFRLATKQLDNYRQIPRVKKKIARINTIIRERELSGGL